jgi:hypothetical protein
MKGTFAVAVIALGMVIEAKAYVPTYLAPEVAQAANPSESEIIAALADRGVTVSDLGDSLYKSDSGGTMFSTSIETQPQSQGLRIATLTYNGGTPLPDLTYIIVKDGKAGYTIWDAATWDGSPIVVDNRDLWANRNNRAAISHIQVWGNGGGTSVPDPSTTIALLGIALLGVESFRRLNRK